MRQADLSPHHPAQAAPPLDAPRLLSRLYRSADPVARAGILSALMRPLGPLGLAAVASGAFAGFVARRRGAVVEVGVDEVGPFTSEQVFELARFVQQVDAAAFLRTVTGIAASPVGFTAFGLALALLLLRRSRGGDEGVAGGGSTADRPIA
jgi:hypothetical protein